MAIVGVLALQASAPTRLLVFPLEGRSAVDPRVKQASLRVLDLLRRQKDLEVVESEIMSRDLGIDLSVQVRECDFDVLCLVQVGEAVEADKILLGRVRNSKKGERLTMSVIDVAKAALVDNLRWIVPERQKSLGYAARAAVRHLLLPPNARIVPTLTPEHAKIYLYGDLVGSPPYEGELPFWSGVYYGTVEAEGHFAKDIKLTVPDGGPTRIEVVLEADPSYVPPPDPGRAVKAKEDPDYVKERHRKEAEREGRRLETKAEREAEAQMPPALRAWLNPIAWSLVGAGGVTILAGGLMMSGAQSDYNELSGQTRFSPDRTGPVPQAARVREDARSQFSTGSAVAVIGALTSLGGVAWMLVDSILSDAPAEGSIRSSRALSVSPLLGTTVGGVAEVRY